MYLDRVEAAVFVRALLAFAERYTVVNDGQADEATSLCPCTPACHHFEHASPCSPEHLMDLIGWIAALGLGGVDFVCQLSLGEADTARCALDAYAHYVRGHEPAELPTLSDAAFSQLVHRVDREYRSRRDQHRRAAVAVDRPLAAVLTLRPWQEAR